MGDLNCADSYRRQRLKPGASVKAIITTLLLAAPLAGCRAAAMNTSSSWRPRLQYPRGCAAPVARLPEGVDLGYHVPLQWAETHGSTPVAGTQYSLTPMNRQLWGVFEYVDGGRAALAWRPGPSLTSPSSPPSSLACLHVAREPQRWIVGGQVPGRASWSAGCLRVHLPKAWYCDDGWIVAYNREEGSAAVAPVTYVQPCGPNQALLRLHTGSRGHRPLDPVLDAISVPQLRLPLPANTTVKLLQSNIPPGAQSDVFLDSSGVLRANRWLFAGEETLLNVTVLFVVHQADGITWRESYCASFLVADNAPADTRSPSPLTRHSAPHHDNAAPLAAYAYRRVQDGSDSPSASGSASVSPSASVTPSASSSASASTSLSATYTSAPTPASTATSTSTGSIPASPTSSHSVSESITPSGSLSLGASPASTHTVTPTDSPTKTSTHSPSDTGSPSDTSSSSVSPSSDATQSSTASLSQDPDATITATVTPDAVLGAPQAGLSTTIVVVVIVLGAFVLFGCTYGTCYFYWRAADSKRRSMLTDAPGVISTRNPALGRHADKSTMAVQLSGATAALSIPVVVSSNPTNGTATKEVSCLASMY
jgi:hypothetical protein